MSKYIAYYLLYYKYYSKYKIKNTHKIHAGQSSYLDLLDLVFFTTFVFAIAERIRKKTCIYILYVDASNRRLKNVFHICCNFLNQNIFLRFCTKITHKTYIDMFCVIYNGIVPSFYENHILFYENNIPYQNILRIVEFALSHLHHPSKPSIPLQ